MEELYTQATLQFEKLAQSGKVGESADMWPQEILDMFYSQLPYLAQYEVVPILRDPNEERGYAVGYVTVKNKPQSTPKDVDTSDVTREVRFPFVIKERVVSPFDIFLVGETFYPVTEKNVQSALFQPEVFDIVRSTPGDISLVNQLYPPYRSRYGFGTSFESGVGGKFSSVNANVIEQLIPTMSEADIKRLETALSESPQLKAVVKLSHVRPLLEKLSEIETMSAEDMKAMRRKATPPDVIQLVKEGSKVHIKYANSQLFAPQTETVTIKEAAEMLPAAVRSKLSSEGDTTLSTDPVIKDSFSENKAFVIKNFGVYHVHRKGQSAEHCSEYNDMATVFTSVVDFDMHSLPVTISVFCGGEWSMQSRVSGRSITIEHGGDEMLKKLRNTTTVRDFLPRIDRPSSGTDISPVGYSRDNTYGMVEKYYAMPKLGTVIFCKEQTCTSPIDIQSVSRDKSGNVRINGIALDRSVTLIPTEGIKKIEEIGPNSYALPMELTVVHLGKLVEANDTPDEYIKVSSVSVQIISDGSVYSFRGHPCLEKISHPTTFLDRRDAMFISASLGMSIPFADRMLKLASTSGVATVEGIRPIVSDEEQIHRVLSSNIVPSLKNIATLKECLLKEAAVMPDEETVDKVMSLNFLTPENVTVFAKNLPAFEEVASKLAELLLAIRVGLKEIPETAVAKAMASLQAVIEGLRELRFNQPPV
jgi:hypothetical protein